MISLCPFRIFASSISMVCGTVLIIHSMMAVKSDNLQIDKYIGNIFRERSSSRFHLEVIGCCFISISFGIMQTVGSLMYFLHEIKLNGWIWMNFSCIIAHAICLFTLDPYKPVVHTFTEYYMSLVTNTFIGTTTLFLGVLFKAFKLFNVT